jgi:hypothetical protein
MKKVKFEYISQNEMKFEYKDMKFILQEQKVGVYGLGRCVSLYQLEGLKKTFVKCIGWTKTDNHGGPGKDCISLAITTMFNCRQLAVNYIDNLLR